MVGPPHHCIPYPGAAGMLCMTDKQALRAALRAALVRTAAIAVAWIESLDALEDG